MTGQVTSSQAAEVTGGWIQNTAIPDCMYPEQMVALVQATLRQLWLHSNESILIIHDIFIKGSTNTMAKSTSNL